MAKAETFARLGWAALKWQPAVIPELGPPQPRRSGPSQRLPPPPELRRLCARRMQEAGFIKSAGWLASLLACGGGGRRRHRSTSVRVATVGGQPSSTSEKRNQRKSRSYGLYFMRIAPTSDISAESRACQELLASASCELRARLARAISSLPNRRAFD